MEKKVVIDMEKTMGKEVLERSGCVQCLETIEIHVKRVLFRTADGKFPKILTKSSINRGQ